VRYWRNNDKIIVDLSEADQAISDGKVLLWLLRTKWWPVAHTQLLSAFARTQRPPSGTTDGSLSLLPSFLHKPHADGISAERD
jgi:hypothetical protein